MIKEIVIILLLSIILAGAAYWKIHGYGLFFQTLNKDQMYKQIVQQRDLAIQKAVAAGDYRCCIEPPCSMCYMKANQWNNYTAGTCACDDLIAEGKDPCPECQKGNCEEGNDACKSALKD